jgi:hypothetical protein
LPSLIAPVLRNEKQRPITLVITEISSQSGWHSDEVRAEQCRGIRHLLQGCLHSDMDVLLPKMGVTGPLEIFVVVATTDGIGGEAISKRIQEQLDGSEHFQQAGLTFSTSYRSLEAIKRKTSESIEDLLGKVATNIQELMNEEIASRMVKNGQ